MTPIIVFAGPTLGPREIRQILPEADVRAPAAQGDLYRAARQRPWAIALIDGVFEREPAVWHKEVLWALSQGIHVYGSSSMGALRAAELAAFGMVGVGTIFERYADGTLEGDDEVALAHAGAEHDHRPLSEALVNVRATLEAAVHDDVLDAPSAQTLTMLAEAAWYPTRSWPDLLTAAAAEGVSPRAIATMRAWLPSGRVDQKRLDALQLLERIAQDRAARTPPPAVGWHFEHTLAWDELSRVEATRVAHVAEPGDTSRALADELRLRGEDAYRRGIQGALLRGLARMEAHRGDVGVGAEERQAAADRLRREHGLADVAATDAWLAARGLDRDGLTRLAAGQATLRWLEETFASLIAEHLLEEVQTGPDALHLRALDKQRRLLDADLAGPPAPEPDAAQLLAGYAARHGGVPVDPTALSLRLGLTGPDELLLLLRREWRYLTLLAEAGPREGAPAGSRGG